MENSDIELSGRVTAFFSWIEFLGLLLLIFSRIFFRNYEWISLAGLVLICSGYFYKMYADWRRGRKKAVRARLIFLVLALAAALVVGYISFEKNA